jgi:O-antigen ligase
MRYTSGRNTIWALSWEYYLQQPIFGYGYVAGENNLLFSHFKGVITTHNFILSALIGTGFMGALLLIGYFTSAFFTAISNVFKNSKWKVAFVSTIIMAAIVSLTAPGLGARVYGSWIPVVFMITLISGLKLKAEKEIK